MITQLAILGGLLIAIINSGIYLFMICPRVPEQSLMTKIITPSFILDEFKKTTQEDLKSKRIYRLYLITFFLPVIIIVLGMLISPYDSGY